MTKNIYFQELTGFRAIAAFMVYIHHYNPFNITFFGQSIHDFFNEFHIGVTFFFVLSGFLITHRYFDFDKIDFKKYLINRFARIYPMYFILTSLTFLFFAIYDSQTSLKDLVVYFLNITFLKGYFDNFKFSGIAQGWSLSVEEMFYFIAPVFFILIKRSKFFLFILPFFFILTGLSIVSFFGGLNFYGLMKNNFFMLDFTFFGRITEFFIGIGLALFIRRFKSGFKIKYFTFIGIIVIVLSVYILSKLKTANGFGTDCLLGKIINTLLLPLFGIAPLIFGLIYEKTIVSKALQSKTMVLLGKSSFVFYLIHIGFFATLLNKIFSNYFIVFAFLNIISIFMYIYIEIPMNHLFKKFRML